MTDEERAIHKDGATYIKCDECGAKIWDDTDDFWIESQIGALCSKCIAKSFRISEKRLCCAKENCHA